jgi:hypothetical protein
LERIDITMYATCRFCPKCRNRCPNRGIVAAKTRQTTVGTAITALGTKTAGDHNALVCIFELSN